MGLREYHKKRDFTRTAEPRGRTAKSSGRSYVIQKHAASRLHYDFRLEHAGTLLSWAVPKGPSLDPAEKRLAVRVEDHPVEYGKFEGVIPQGQYGGGSVLLWDRGRWKPDGDVDAGLRSGKLEFELEGEKLRGAWRLIRLKARDGEADKNWLLMKRTDDHARGGDDARGGDEITDARPESVVSGALIEDIGSKRRARVWNSDRATESSASKSAKGPATRASVRRREPGTRASKDASSSKPTAAASRRKIGKKTRAAGPSAQRKRASASRKQHPARRASASARRSA